MSVDQLITEVLTNLRNHFYADKRPRDFLRDRTALMRAIARYGYECEKRNWQFDAAYIFRDLMALLLQIRTADQSHHPQSSILYLPVYLEGAIDRHIRQRAEELSAHAKTIAPKIAKLTTNLKTVEAIREKTDTEILGALFKTLRKPRRQASQPHRPATKQKELL